ncbi:GNAT family N-acetyltransferase [Kiloniella majae]|uniref:GNAT family N-acetyltransferase n=1 Tax=Kiloniella majae TaxID=1938558 RepID=UPI001C3F6522|nr:GNAT family N-acetyltransferase [Kiloniella majae]
MTESINKDHFEIRLAQEEEIQLLCDLAAGEGWNPGLRDIECFYQADRTGFYIGILKGEPIGCISAVKYGNNYGFVGFYIIREPWRGKGFGLAIWDHALASLKGRIIGLDGVVDQQDNYIKSGFKLAHRNIRFEGKAKALTSKASSLVDVKNLPFEQVAAFDAGCFFEERKAFLKAWLGEEGHMGFAAVEDQQLKGYGLIRPYCDGYKTGPLFADNSGVANDIFNGLCAEIEGSNIILDVPENNADGLLLAERYELVQSFETARMYKGGSVDLPLDRVYGITSFELG